MDLKSYTPLGTDSLNPLPITENSSQTSGKSVSSLNESCSTESWKNPFLTKWDWRFIKLAEEVKTWSKDPRKQVGCVLAVGKRDISRGYNGFPEGLSDDISRLKDPFFKGNVIIHAEVNAILNAAKFGVQTAGSTAYVTYHPCAKCASQLIQAGVVKVVSPSPKLASEKWVKDFNLASQILFEAGLCTLYYEPDDEP